MSTDRERNRVSEIATRETFRQKGDRGRKKETRKSEVSREWDGHVDRK